MMTQSPLPTFPYGAVYFRKSNPPPEDWARDYATAAEDGHTLFRHWFLWSAIEVAPGEFVWDDYDRQLELAAEHGIKTIVAEMVTVAPAWAYRRYAHARLEARDGRKLDARMHGSCVVGGAPGLCLDHEDARAAAERFLRALVTRYREHPGLGGYDIWNECNIWQDVCFCPATAERFRAWLREVYDDDLQALGAAWHTPSLASWEDVTPPRHRGPYPDTLDWLAFRKDNAYRLMRWRADLIRELDPDHPVTAHGVAGSLTRMASGAADDWRAAAEVESYGYTWGSSRHGDEPWKQMHAVDLVRAAARGKRFWHAEAYAGPLWMQRQVIGKPRDEGRIATPEDVRYWDMVSFMGGATGLLYLRWRPLLDGPLFGAFGPYGMDGSRTPRSEMAGEIAHWVAAPAQARLWRARPVRGSVGIVVVPETQAFLYAQQGDATFYARSAQGAYRGFFDLNVQADWVRVEHIDAYDVLYLPIPVMLTQATADRLREWVAAGGLLVAEGCPGYFDGRGHVGTVQPNLGLDVLFGARESYVEFTPDLLDDLRVSVDGTPAWGGVFLQAYTPTTGTARGRYEGVPGRADGQVAVVDHAYGEGRTRLVGTMVGYGHAHHAARVAGAAPFEPGGSPAFFADLMAWAGTTPHVSSSDPFVKARLHAGEGSTFLWVANATGRDRPVRLTLGPQWGPFAQGESLWGPTASVDGREVALTAPARDVAVIELLAE
jgi:beta-galactosidase